MEDPSRKPNEKIRSVLAIEDVYILGDKQIKAGNDEYLKMAEDYYKTTLETLCGTQIWDIIDTLKCIEREIHIRKQSSPFKSLSLRA